MSPAALVLGLLLSAGGLYYLAALAAAFRFRRPPLAPFTPPVSVLKPVLGLDRRFYECIRSHADQDYPEFELLFAVRDPDDPAIAEIRRMAAEFPQRRIEVFRTERDLGPNAKVNNLERLRPECRYSVLVVDDSDVRVGPDWLRRVVAPLADSRVGLVTSPYRGAPAGGLPSLLEALWISTDFQASVLVARWLGIRFALGATMAFRRQQLEHTGGFAPLAPYLADDYLLGKRIHECGLEIVLSDCVVETVLPPDGWRASWRRRLRWARTVRVCRPGGAAGMLITFVIPLSLVLLAVARPAWPLAVASVALRLAAAWTVGRGLLQDPVASRYFLLIPLADVASFVVWAGGFWGRHVFWRGVRFRLARDGRLAREN